MMNLPLFHEHYCAQTYWYDGVLREAARKEVIHTNTFNKLLRQYEYANTACAYAQHHPYAVSDRLKEAAGKAYIKAKKNVDSWLKSVPEVNSIIRVGWIEEDEDIII